MQHLSDEIKLKDVVPCPRTVAFLLFSFKITLDSPVYMTEWQLTEVHI
jgi:hypothetical protein